MPRGVSQKHFDETQLYPSGTTEAHRRVIDHAPTGDVDRHHPPSLVAKVEIEPAVSFRLNEAIWSVQNVNYFCFVSRRNAA